MELDGPRAVVQAVVVEAEFAEGDEAGVAVGGDEVGEVRNKLRGADVVD